MKHLLVLVIGLAYLFSPASYYRTPDDELIPISDAEQAIAVTTHDLGLASDGNAKLVVAVWTDGTIVWSENRIVGGAPHLLGKIEPTSCSKLLERLDRDGYFDNETLSHAQFGPDSEFTSVLIKNKNQKLDMRSWHELYESSGKIVCTSGSAEALVGKRLASLAEDEKEYVHYRLAWAELRLMINQLIPSNGKSTTGELHMEHGKMSWKLNPK